jgi:HNH endonuclease
MEVQREEIVFEGVSYFRYPNSRQRAHRVYYESNDHVTLHRAVWESAHGPVPEGLHVHHKDLNPLNNESGNLECLSPIDHAARHPRGYDLDRLARIRPLAAAWHSSPEGIEWHREHGRESWNGRTTEKAVCAFCGGQFERFFARARFCSDRCIQRHNERSKRYYEDRKCVICAASFSVKASKKQATCSRLCGAENRKRKAR